MAPYSKERPIKIKGFKSRTKKCYGIKESVNSIKGREPKFN